jgi:HD-GYP domain-containing protein (c-di-GMP phosphodiesterase class II)
MTLGHPIYAFNGDLLLAAGQALDDYFIARLSRLGFPGAYIEEAGFESVEPQQILDGALRASTEVLLSDCFEKLADANLSEDLNTSLDLSLDNHPELTKALPLGKIRTQVNQIVQDVLDQFQTQLPCLLLKSQSRYQVQHGMDTMIVSILLGVNFRFLYRELRQLALAAMLHDIGKSFLIGPGEDNISPDHPRYKEHPQAGGLLLLAGSDDAYIECAAIQQHHERQDGNGFPLGLKGEGKLPQQGRAYHPGSIYRLAEIIAVADAYDVLTSGAYGQPLSPEAALINLIQRNGTEFNPHVLKMLARVIQIFPVGCQIRIINESSKNWHQYRGIVTKINQNNPHRVEMILSHDNRGDRIPARPLSLQGDENARLELVL